jgi:hypothetical protein
MTVKEIVDQLKKLEEAAVRCSDAMPDQQSEIMRAIRDARWKVEKHGPRAKP